MKLLPRILVLSSLLALAACQSTPPLAEGETAPPPTKPSSQSASKGGGYYLDDGPGQDIPPDLDQIADATPRNEPLHRYANKPYTVMGREYTPAASVQPFRQKGIASWYGKRFHGQKTSSGEDYDMYAMTAAHPTLPIPSYARVTNVANGRAVVVRINDRGPFLHDRIIDLSYAAAHRLGYIKQGSATVEVEAIVPPAEGANAGQTPIAGGIYVQLGAFSSRENAENLKNRVAQDAPELAAQLGIAPADKLFRVLLGPYKSRQEAEEWAAQVGGRFKLQPRIVARETVF